MLAEWLAQGILQEQLPEVAALQGVMQQSEHHPEGDAYTHTLLAVAAVDDDEDPRLFWGVLLHDIGKASTTVRACGRWQAHGHAASGAVLVPQIMTRLGYPGLAADVTWLVKHHDFALSWNLKPGDSITPRQRKLLAHPLFMLLRKLCMADAVGAMNPSRSEDFWRLIEQEIANSDSRANQYSLQQRQSSFHSTREENK